MLGDLRLLLTDQYRQETKRWLSALRRKESVAVSFIPKTDRIIRLEQLFGDPTLLQDGLGNAASNYHFQFIDFASPVPEDAHDLEVKIAALLDKTQREAKSKTFAEWVDDFQKRERTLVLVISEAEKLLNPAQQHTLTLLSYLIDQYYPRVLVISCFEVNVSHSSVMAMLSPSTRLYANIFEYPLYTDANTRLFIELLEAEWGITVSEKDKQTILGHCGGHFWLVKEAVRRLADGQQWSPEQEGTVFRLRTIFGQLLPSEQRVIKKLTAGKSDFTTEERLSLAYLQRMRLVEGGACTIGMMKNFILTHEEKPAGFSLVNNVVFLNNVPVDKVFSRKEHRVVRLLIEHEDEIVSRNDIAQVLWPVDTEKEYSDWAIDQIMARVRKRLVQLYVSPHILKVIRGKGYLLNLTK